MTTSQPIKISTASASVLCVLLVIALLVRFHALGRNSFWRDEFLSLESSAGQTRNLASLPTNTILHSPPSLTQLNRSATWSEIWHPEELEIHPPLYFLLLRGWRRMFGDSETAVRSLSAIASVVAVLFFYLTLNMQAGRSIALWGSLLLIFAGAQIYAAQTARPYALWMALAMAAAYIVISIKIAGISNVRLISLTACTAAMLLTHYFAALSIGALAIYTLIFFRKRKCWLTIGSFFAGSMLFLILWGKNLPAQLRFAPQGVRWLIEPAQGHLFRTAIRLIETPLRSLTAVGEFAPVSIVFVVILITGICVSRRDSRIWFWLIWLLPLFVVTALDVIRQTRMLEVARYTFVADVALCALIPIFSQHFFRQRTWVLPLLVLLPCLIFLSREYPRPTEWRRVAGILRDAVHPGDVVVYASGGDAAAEALQLYLGISHYAPDLPASTLLLTDIHAPIAAALPRPGQTLWLICFNPEVRAARIFPAAMVEQEIVLPNIGRFAELIRRPIGRPSTQSYNSQRHN